MFLSVQKHPHSKSAQGTDKCCSNSSRFSSSQCSCLPVDIVSDTAQGGRSKPAWLSLELDLLPAHLPETQRALVSAPALGHLLEISDLCWGFIPAPGSGSFLIRGVALNPKFGIEPLQAQSTHSFQLPSPGADTKTPGNAGAFGDRAPCAEAREVQEGGNGPRASGTASDHWGHPMATSIPMDLLQPTLKGLILNHQILTLKLFSSSPWAVAV